MLITLCLLLACRVIVFPLSCHASVCTDPRSALWLQLITLLPLRLLQVSLLSEQHFSSGKKNCFSPESLLLFDWQSISCQNGHRSLGVFSSICNVSCTSPIFSVFIWTSGSCWSIVLPCHNTLYQRASSPLLYYYKFIETLRLHGLSQTIPFIFILGNTQLNFLYSNFMIHFSMDSIHSRGWSYLPGTNQFRCDFRFRLLLHVVYLPGILSIMFSDTWNNDPSNLFSTWTIPINLRCHSLLARYWNNSNNCFFLLIIPTAKDVKILLRLSQIIIKFK